jgi:hypothetical protein
MKKIQTIQIWVNGEIKTGSWLGAKSIYDNLETTAQFIYWISENSVDPEQPENKPQIVNGNLTMDGQDYIDWNSNPDINEDAYIWIANKLGLTLI